MNRWYVVHTHANGERKALFHLRRQGYDAYMPQYARRVSHARRVEWCPRPLFPRYLFVSLDIDVEAWRAIQSTLGVKYMICHDERPAPVPEGIIEDLKAAENESGLVTPAKRANLKTGDMVQITSGALVDQIGLFECRTDDERVVVLLNLLGREVRTTVSLESIAVCG